MDPLSITTACLAIGRAAVSTSVEIHNVIKKVKDVPQVVRSLHVQLRMTDQITRRLHDWLERDPQVLTADESQTLKLSLVECHTLMLQIRKHLDTSKGNGGSSFLRRAKHVWNEAALKEDQERLKTQLNAQ
jgi:hypothetical protein